MLIVLTTALLWAFWFGFPALVIRLDAKRQRAAARARGEVDLLDRSVTPYLVTALFCGGLPLVVYFGTTRRSALGWLTGLGLALVQFALLMVLSGGLYIVNKRAMVEQRFGPNHGMVID